MICTCVVPCLFSGLAKNNKIMSMFVLFSRISWPFVKFGFFPNIGGENLSPKQSNRTFSINFSKMQQLSDTFLRKSGYFDKTSEGKQVTAGTYRGLSQQKLCFVEKIFNFTVFWGQR